MWKAKKISNVTENRILSNSERVSVSAFDQFKHLLQFAILNECLEYAFSKLTVASYEVDGK
jgi:hypothetical protein